MATIDDVQEIVTNRIAALLVQAQALAGDTSTPNADQSLAWAMRALGVAVASPLYATQAEVDAVGPERLDALLDLLELRMLESIQTGFTAVTVQAGPVREDYNHLADRLDRIVNEKRDNAAARHKQWLTVPLSGNAPKRATLRAV